MGAVPCLERASILARSADGEKQQLLVPQKRGKNHREHQIQSTPFPFEIPVFTSESDQLLLILIPPLSACVFKLAIFGCP